MALAEPRLSAGQWYEVPRISEVMGRLSGGRASEILVRHWLNGTRRAPAWFVAVLRGEIERQIEERERILQGLADYQPQEDRAARAARMRALILAGKIGPGAKKRMGEASGKDTPGKNEP